MESVITTGEIMAIGKVFWEMKLSLVRYVRTKYTICTTHIAVASIADGATGRHDRNLVSSISTWVASYFNSSS